MSSCSKRIRLTSKALEAIVEHQKRLFASQDMTHSWKWLKERGHNINPCRSKLHPAVVLAGLQPEEGAELSVQEAYSPESSCWGCGPASTIGLNLRSFRTSNGLFANLRIPKEFQAFPGIINGGIISVAFDCHGNWSAAVALMDKAALPRPPFTLSSSLQVQYLEPTPPDTPLQLQSRIISIEDHRSTGADKVTVELALTQPLPDSNKRLLATGRGIFMKRGALRAL